MHTRPYSWGPFAARECLATRQVHHRHGLHPTVIRDAHTTRPKHSTNRSAVFKPRSLGLRLMRQVDAHTGRAGHRLTRALTCQLSSTNTRVATRKPQRQSFFADV